MRIGVIGAGNMANAIIQGVINSGMFLPEQITVSDIDEGKLAPFAERGVRTAKSNAEVVLRSNYIILAVKPHVYQQVLADIHDYYEGKVFISIAPGITIEYIKNKFGDVGKVVRAMPNTPALVGEGMTVLCTQEPVTEEEFKVARDIFASFGKTVVLPEELMDAAVAVNGSSPAYVFMMIEAMADEAVMNGIPRDTAYLLAAQSVLGSAKMVLQTKLHPGVLKDMVCSPGGTTIEAVHQLEVDGFRAAIINAMDRCTQKASKMSRKHSS